MVLGSSIARFYSSLRGLIAAWLTPFPQLGDAMIEYRVDELLVLEASEVLEVLDGEGFCGISTLDPALFLRYLSSCESVCTPLQSPSL